MKKIQNKETAHFIATSDEKTATLLRELGYVELPKEGNKWKFLNNGDKIVFSSKEAKINYTDMLTF